jgi:hypothetical protein
VTSGIAAHPLEQFARGPLQLGTLRDGRSQLL